MLPKEHSCKIWLSTFCPDNAVCLLRLLHIQVHLKLDFIMEANTMNPDQTAPKEQSDLGTCCLPYRRPKSGFIQASMNKNSRTSKNLSNGFQGLKVSEKY